MNVRQALVFVERHGVVLESAKGPAPNLAEAIVGSPIQGGWWGHPLGHTIFNITQAVRDSKDILTCRLLDGKITFVHRRCWPALVRLAGKFRKERLAAVSEIHTNGGAHRAVLKAYPRWVPAWARKQAARLSESEASRLLGPASK